MTGTASPGIGSGLADGRALVAGSVAVPGWPRHARGPAGGKLAGVAAVVMGFVFLLAPRAAATMVPAPARATTQQHGHLVVTHTISVGHAPGSIGVDPRTDMIYVTNHNDDTMSVISGQTATVVATITIAPSPGDLAVNSQTNRIYVVNGAFGQPRKLFVINGHTNTVTAAITVHSPTAVAVNQLTNQVYVTSDSNGTKPGRLLIFNGRTNTLTASVPVVRSPDGVAVNPLTKRIYVTSFRFKGAMSVISSQSDRVLATVRLGGTPSGLAVDSRADKVYVPMFPGSPVGSRARILVISGRTDKIIATIKIDTFGISPNPLTGNIWLTKPNTGQVAVLSGRTYKVISAVSVGQDPGAIAIDPRTGAGYAANSGSDTVSVLRWRK